MKLHARLPEEAFIQVGDFIGTGIRHCARRAVGRAIVVGMIGKLSKMADGKVQTHAAGSEVNMELLATLAAEAGANETITAEIRAANTARHVLELCTARGLGRVTSLVCKRVSDHLQAHAQQKISVDVQLVDFDGKLLGEHVRAS